MAYTVIGDGGTVVTAEGNLEGPFIDYNFEDDFTVTMRYVGPVAALLLWRSTNASNGDVFSIPSLGDLDMPVISAQIPRGGDDSHRTLLVTLKLANPEATNDPLDEPVYELDWIAIQKPIEEHERFIHEDSTSLEVTVGEGKFRQPKWPEDFPLVLTNERDGLDVEGGWIAGPDPNAWDWADYKKLKRAGVDFYFVPAPVIRCTQQFNGKPTGVGQGVWQLENPPGAADAPPGWQWMKTADNITKQGIARTRQQEWTGAKLWEPLLYGP